ncbi:GPW/gp25 family protein [Roseateles sp. BYS78W]|uniref:GPW/gp25 family protein n=1 Tax=Pelomonas candidula TaxID=3299025 RepID=A0ABW7HGR6_9BURK
MATVLDRSRLYGIDLALRDGAGGADLSLVGPVGLYGDIALAAGNDDIVQALALRLRVRVGELALLGWPDYGSRLHELIGEPDLPRTRLKAQAFARAAIEADPRVAKVDAVEIVSIPGERQILRLSMDVHLITEQRPLNLVFDLALSGTEALP